MTVSIRNITFDCADPWALSEFWSQVTGWPRHPENGPTDKEVLLVAPEGAYPRLLFIRVPEPKTVKDRVHLDVQPDGPREEQVAALLELGATLVADHRQPDGGGWVVLTDPEGNEFCVERSAAERAAMDSPA
jgi:predicted enzyme related to lactoylglutathione lyase